MRHAAHRVRWFFAGLALSTVLWLGFFTLAGAVYLWIFGWPQ